MPERLLWSGEAEAVMLRTFEGDITFLAGHASVVGAITPGVVRIQAAPADALGEGPSEMKVLAVHDGFVRIGDHRGVILAGVAELAEDIDVERARRALDASEAALGELASSQAEDAGILRREAEAARQRATLRIEVAEMARERQGAYSTVPA